MPETTPLIKAALNLRVGAGFDVYDTMIVERVGESILDRATQNVFPFFMLPKDMLDYMRVYPIGYEDIPESSS